MKVERRDFLKLTALGALAVPGVLSGCRTIECDRKELLVTGIQFPQNYYNVTLNVTNNVVTVGKGEESISQLNTECKQIQNYWLAAHGNTKAGGEILTLEKNETLFVYLQSGNIKEFLVAGHSDYIAEDPDLPTSELTNLMTGKVYTSKEFIDEHIVKPGVMVLQTCLNLNGVYNAGRRFVFAV